MPKDGYKRIVDPKMKCWGYIDEKKKIIRIRKKGGVIGHIKNKPGNVLDTIVHEEIHRKHPKLNEWQTRRKTKRDIKKMSDKQKQKYYNLYK
jgi:hypothetical protein